MVHEDFDVLADAVLLVDDAEAESRIASIQVGEQVLKCHPIGFNQGLALRVRSQWRRYVDLQRGNSAVWSE